ncbi:MAG: 1-deoxy-D-xylulose-5-phosphate synthase [Clostridia bacterium]|nr:1-deoxy-D-xylulose-5-phosphate synthase [Clostridia bacterium]
MEEKTEKSNLLSSIASPEDVRRLSREQLPVLAQEIRETLIETVSQTGGHLASNLGVVELTIALHRVFHSPKDKIVWDVGHQTYVHKLLTGRYDRFGTLRSEGGISGFSRPDESEHDMFFSGHSSTSVSSALGIAEANKIKGNKNYAVAVLGDGAFTGGMVYEALNNAGRSGTRLIVILNNNEMSISRNVGAMARYLARILSRPSYSRLKSRTERFLNHIPLIGKPLSDAVSFTKSHIKNFIYSSTMFEQFGFRYMGPIDGHDIDALCDALEGAKEQNRPVLLHIRTVKGKGYDYAEKEPTLYHGVSKFDIDSGEPIMSGDNYSKAFGEFLTEMAQKDKRICAVTAAMSVGTGLSPFQEKYPERFFDVGIAEEHAVTFCAGLARVGMLPVFAVYSSFLQRSYDQIVHDGALQGLKMVVAVDRAGFVGDDGETHQGILDVPFLNTVPNITVFSPASYAELRSAFVKAFYHTEGAVFIRYPRGAQEELPEDYIYSENDFDLYGDEDAPICLVTYGRVFSYCCKARESLRDLKIKIIKLNKIKPISQQSVEAAFGSEQIFFFEEGERSGGVGEAFALRLEEAGYRGKYVLTAVPDTFVAQASPMAQLHKYKLDAEGIAGTITEKNSDEA